MATATYVERDTTVGPMKLHYQEWGEPASPPVVMLHGFGLSGHMFDEFASRVADRYHLLALDQRGHGDSSWAEDGDYSREAFVADLEAFRQEQGIERFILVGHSMGGLNAVTYAAEHPERVRALVLVDVGPEAAREGVDNIVRFTRGPDELEFEQFVEMAHQFNPRRDIENIRERMRFRLKPTDDGKWTWKFDKRFRQGENGLRVGSTLSNDQTWELFRAVRAPTLLVRGGLSDVLTQEVAERCVREMPRARLVVVPEAGHSVPGDNPEAFTQAVTAFLDDIEAGLFAPVAAAEPPPLDVAMEHSRHGRKRGSLVGLVVLGAGAVIAVAGVRYALKQRKKSSRQRKLSLRGKDRGVHVPAVDLEHAQQRATDLAHELAAAGRAGIGQARHAVQQVELERARKSALEVLNSLEAALREAPTTARAAARRVDRDTAAKRGSQLLHSVMTIAPFLLAATQKRKRRRKRGVLKLARWRS